MTQSEQIEFDRMKTALQIYADPSNWSHFDSQVGCRVWTWKKHGGEPLAYAEAALLEESERE